MLTRLLSGRLMPATIAIVPYPCRCRCLAVTQTTRTTPLRRMILHFWHRFFTDGVTCIVNLVVSSAHLPEPVGDASPCQVVRRELHKHSVTRKHADEVHTNLAGRVRQ